MSRPREAARAGPVRRRECCRLLQHRAGGLQRGQGRPAGQLTPPEGPRPSRGEAPRLRCVLEAARGRRADLARKAPGTGSGAPPGVLRLLQHGGRGLQQGQGRPSGALTPPGGARVPGGGSPPPARPGGRQGPPWGLRPAPPRRSGPQGSRRPGPALRRSAASPSVRGPWPPAGPGTALQGSDAAGRGRSTGVPRGEAPASGAPWRPPVAAVGLRRLCADVRGGA